MQCRRNWIPPAGPEVEEGIAMARKAIAAAGDDPLVLVYAGQTLALLAGWNPDSNGAESLCGFPVGTSNLLVPRLCGGCRTHDRSAHSR